MTPGRPTIDPELLLAQTGWVRSLARSLAIDAAGAEDVAQEAILAALQAPPNDAEDALRLRAWLARVVYNLSHLRTRRNARRRVREEWVARPERTSSVAETVERAARLKLVVGAVMELDEPYRSTVLLRYFDGLSTAEVAERMGVTSENVRKRLSRALQRLRRDLDDAHGGDGHSWLAALTPLLAPQYVRPMALPVGVLGPAVAAAGLVGTLVLAVGVGGSNAGPSASAPGSALALADPGAPDEGAGGRRALAPVASDPTPRRSPAERWLAVGTVEVLPSEPRAPLTEERAPAAVAAAAGQAFDLDGRALGGIALAAEHAPSQVLATTAFDGAFELAAAAGTRLLPAAGEGWAAVRLAVVGEPGEPLALVAAPAVDVLGRVVDELGAPLAGARVELVVGDAALVAVPAPLEHTVAAARSGRTDGHGAFAWPAVPSGAGLDLRISSPGREKRLLPVPAGLAGSTVEIECVLPATTERSLRTVHGYVVHASGAPASGALVRLGPYEARADDAGAFALTYGELPGSPVLLASLDGFEGARAAGPGAWLPGPGGSPALELVLGAALHRLEGRVVDAAGAPRRGWNVVAVAAGREDGASEVAMARTDEGGAFVLDDLAAGEHVVQAFDPESLLLVQSEPLDPKTNDGTLLLRVPDDAFRSIRGRVVARGGVPLAGATVRPALAVPGPEGVEWRYGAETRTDADGRFALERVPREHVGLEARHGSAATTVAEPSTLSHDWVRIEVARTGYLRVLGGDADELRVLDGAGRALRLQGPSGADLRARLYDGRSPLLRTSEEAQEVVFLRDGRVVGRRRLDLAPGARLDVGGPSAP